MTTVMITSRKVFLKAVKTRGSLNSRLKFSKLTNSGGRKTFHSKKLKTNVVIIGPMMKISSPMTDGAINR